MLNEAKISRPRPRPGSWGRGQPRPGSWGRGQPRPRPFFEVEAKNEAKGKVMNKKYQMMIDSIQVNLNQYDQNDTV